MEKMNEWTVGELKELTSHFPVYIVVDIRTNRIICRRVRRKKDDIMACEKKEFAKINNVEPGYLLYQDCRKNVFALKTLPGTSLYDSIQNAIVKGKL